MGVKERKLREKEIRRREILKAAEKLFSGKKGMDSTMDDLAELTELGKGTLYLYFPNKESILQALAEKGIKLLKKRLKRILDDSKTGVEQISDNGDVFVHFLRDKPFYSALLLKYEQTVLQCSENDEKILMVEPILAILQEILKNGQGDGTIRNDIGTKELVTILWSQMLGILNTLSGRKELLQLYGVDEEWIIRGHYRVIMSGLAKSES